METWDSLFEPNSLALYFSAVLVVYYAAYQALEFEKYFKEEDAPSITVTSRMAMVYPIVASIFLLVFFYFFSIMSFVMLVSLLFTATTSISFVAFPLFRYLWPQSEKLTIWIPCIDRVSVIYFITGISSLIVLVSWLITGHWILNNVIGLSFCITSISILRVPSVKIACIALVCLFFYDIFWVFYSESIFGENVMLKVATTEAHNPMSTIASTFGINSVVKSIQLPMKVIWGNRILGLGDIVLPGSLVAFSLKLDCCLMKKRELLNYFYTSMYGYSVGLFCAMLVALVYRIAQPALLYLVPCTLLPILVKGWLRNELVQIWQGPLQPYKLNNYNLPH